MTNTIDIQIQRVQMGREHLAQLQAQRSAALRQWEQDHVQLLEGIKEAAALLAIQEDELRRMAVEQYTLTGTKKVAPGVGIRVVTKLEYEPATALEWAKTHGLALALNTKEFEKVARATAIPFVTLVEEATATIATDLAVVARTERMLDRQGV